jgi:hypothetical protein
MSGRMLALEALGVHMGFWIYMLIMSTVVPFTMIGFGSYFVRSSGPEKINMAFGYRSSMSMKNDDTWKFAHAYCGKVWRIMGWAMLPVSAAAMLFVLGKGTGTVGTFGAVVLGAQCVSLVASIIPTEKALRKHFDKDGNRKN